MPANLLIPAGMIVSPLVPQGQLAVAPNFERFDGLTLPTTNPATSDPMSGGSGMGADYGFQIPGHYPRPGSMNTPVADQVYTPGPIRGVVGTVGGQPVELVAANHTKGMNGDYTQSKTHSIQFRKGVGQNNQGAAQTVALSEITNNPPQPGDLTAIIAGLA